MSCNRADIPEYLHWDDRPKFPPEAFENVHCMYRMHQSTNPVEFPGITGHSCNWSKFIDEGDLIAVTEPKLGSAYSFAYISDIKTITINDERSIPNQPTFWHKLTCLFEHEPIDCNYSHSEINICHQIFSDQAQQNRTFYLEVKWLMCQDKKNGPLLAQDPPFFKALRNKYRTEMVKVFKHKGTAIQNTYTSV